jgi:hypothetical protein
MREGGVNTEKEKKYCDMSRPALFGGAPRRNAGASTSRPFTCGDSILWCVSPQPSCLVLGGGFADTP